MIRVRGEGGGRGGGGVRRTSSVGWIAEAGRKGGSGEAAVRVGRRRVVSERRRRSRGNGLRREEVGESGLDMVTMVGAGCGL